ncbi:flavodoxin domain-containing protein [Halogeometricum luteum]|uniref:Flavodoxin domain-containing protein n=1 Tax=Halogeometricum luteum TaxID=2950537 RepID=A0ABU2FY80_9EURY|nr:flavodoxin domain-containing protein [Halogeometricum sp. S3BR5-2]MDS0292974.1 flavodoxin domain-containing protein [Halogeometricum sp. S3BR5-2]
MTATLVAYGTGEGQTAKVADRIVDALRERGHEAEAVDVKRLPRGFDLDAYDAVLVGGSVHAGRLQRGVRRFVRAHREELASRPTAFVQVCLSAVDNEEAAARAAHDFLRETEWDPDRVAVLGGALRYSEYGFLKRALMKRIAAESTGDVDTSRDYEYTDWEEVERFAADFAAFVEGEVGDAAAPREDTPV